MINSLKEIKNKEFSNGAVYLLHTADGYPIETTDTFLPIYTLNAIERKQNGLTNKDLGSRLDRWMVGVSVMSGCPVRCQFCATAQLKKWRCLTVDEITDQVRFIWDKHRQIDPARSKEFKINYTRMGEPFLNINAVHGAIEHFMLHYGKSIHHYISTIGIIGSDFSWIKDNITLQISLHSLNENRRKELIPFPRLMSLEELGQIRTRSRNKTTLNLTLVDDRDFDIELLKKYFDPKYFFIKLSPLNPNCISDRHKLQGIIKKQNLI